MNCAARTQHRIDQMVKLIAQFQRFDMTVTEAATFLGFTHAGAKNYVRDLKLADLLTICGQDPGGVGPRPSIYRLTCSAKQIEHFLTGLGSQKPPKRSTPPGAGLLAQCQKDPSRHLHLLRDDTHYPPPIHRLKPFRDALVAALFGPAHGAQA